VRAVFLILLVANLLFLAWARWIDTPSDAGAQDVLSRLPRLQLVTESPPGTRPTSANLIPAAAQKVALRAPEAEAEVPVTCASVGPFNDIARAARAAGLLTQRGFHLQQRAEEGETIEGYWVFVGDLQSDDEVSQVVERLDKSGFADAHVMKNFSTNRRISVGMFSTRERAEKRAAAVKAMGLEPEVGERKFPGTVYWVDVALTSRAQKPPPEYLFADIGHAKVQMQPCPVGLRAQDREGVPAPATHSDQGDRVTRVLPRTTVASAKPQR
jgi:hypothetical protein